MRSGRATLVLLLCALAVLALPAAAHEATQATPPNRNDPCARNAKNVCGTTGVGYYKVGQYGPRWYGDFRGAIAGFAHSYCIDLRFWYPSASYKYREDTSGSLVNKEGQAIPAERKQRIAYAVARFGQTTDPDQAAAVMLYVHTQIGDQRPGELDPADAGPGVPALYARIARDADDFHGPYRIEFRPNGQFTVGKAASGTVRVVSASGNAVPNVALTVSGDGVTQGQLRSSASGAASVTFTPATTSPRLSIRADGLPSTLPRVFEPTTAAAAPNGQRLVVAGTQSLSTALRSAASKRQIGVTTVAAPSTIAVGEVASDKITITGAAAGWKATVGVKVYGPFPTLAQAKCDGKALVETSVQTNGPGTYTTPAVKVALAGWYTFVIVVPSDAVHVGLTTPCGVPAESFKAQAVPKVTTVVSSQRVIVGTPIYDKIHVEGLAGVPVTIKAALYGPFSVALAAKCDGTPVWTGTVNATADGDYTTSTFTPTLPGYYTYREVIDGTDLTRAAQTVCGDALETTLVVVHPEISTEISSQKATIGSSIFDKVKVKGLGSVAVNVRVELWGPYANVSLVKCTGTPLKVQTIAVTGDGTFQTTPVTITAVGVYTYRASIPSGPLNDAFTAPCGESGETVLVTAPPPPTTTVITTTTRVTTTVTTTVKKPPPPKKPPPKKPVFKPTRIALSTIASDEVVRPGEEIHDRIMTRGIRGPVRVELFGPFATRGAIRCTGTPYWTARVTVNADGEIPSPTALVRKAGFYGFRERVVDANGRTKLLTACAIEAETSLVAPLVVTGKGDEPRYIPAPSVGAATPARVIIPSLSIDAPIAPVGIDTVGGFLGTPTSIHKPGWWRDGAAAGAKTGSILVAGHVDSAKEGPGAFYKLHLLRAGDRVEVRTTGGRTLAYRVVSVRNYRKSALPTSVWSRKGAARLVLVTCGGPFDAASGHYLDNVVVTAVPL